MEINKIAILEKCVAALEYKVYGNNSQSSFSLGSLIDEINKVDTTISNACIGHPNATALLGHVKILDQLMDPFYEDLQLETSKREIILSAETDFVDYAQQLNILKENWPALNNKSYGDLDKYTKDIEKLVNDERKQRNAIKQQTEQIHKLLFMYEQLMLKFSLAFEKLEKAITELEFNSSTKPEESNEA
ncbi:uncharacterized protein LOC126846359 [Adelges cooleyi]|uniref:uncharacterized protein LOC126846359 n=1 Tax=Adelges cooleyi TaxID=133065 RepID=UPI00217F7919|nr:uncharacterized protein LOC126846359 [Adelges cooleyi]